MRSIHLCYGKCGLLALFSSLGSVSVSPRKGADKNSGACPGIEVCGFKVGISFWVSVM